jgi:hypothetical protein
MTAPASTREALHHLIDEMSDDDVQELMDFLNMRADPDELTAEEEAEVEESLRDIERGDFDTLAEFRRKVGG